MTQTKHTAGPWTVSVGKLKDKKPTLEVAQCKPAPAFLKFYKTDDEAFATANLIVASPELLEACKETLIILKATGHYVSSVGKLQQAISKAEGK